MTKKKKNSAIEWDAKEKETVEQFLARGGKIQVVPYNCPSNLDDVDPEERMAMRKRSEIDKKRSKATQATIVAEVGLDFRGY